MPGVLSMRTNVPLDFTDEQRNTLARLQDQKETSRLITRKEVVHMTHEFFDGVLSAYQLYDYYLDNTHTLDYDPLEGKSESYIRGWESAGEKIRQK